MKNAAYGASLIIGIVLILAFGPLAFIWCLNTLFGLGIAYTFWTWLAALGLGSVVGSRSRK